jgi:hypothetical protein
MKRLGMVWGLALGLGLGFPVFSAAAAMDLVTLKDGRVIHGVVVEESKSKIIVQVAGVPRTFERAFVTKITYGESASPESAPAESELASPGEGQGQTVPAPKEDEITFLSERYQVPPSDVVWVRDQGISEHDLPLVYLVAAAAQVPPRQVVRLYLSGLSWDEIEARYGIQSGEVQTLVVEPYPVYCYLDDFPYAWYPGWYGWGWGWWGGHRVWHGPGWRNGGWHGGAVSGWGRGVGRAGLNGAVRSGRAGGSGASVPSVGRPGLGRASAGISGSGHSSGGGSGAGRGR